MSHTPYTVTALGHCRCLRLLRWSSEYFLSWMKYFFQEKYFMNCHHSYFFISQTIVIADANVHVCKSTLDLEIFPRSNCFLLSSAEFEIGCVGNGCHVTHLMNSKDDHYCAEIHFLNVFLMQIAYFLKCFINNWCNSKNWKMNALVVFSC